MPDSLAEKVLSLPRWARVAFAARCARRLQPTVAAWEKVSAAQKKAVANAIEAAEMAAGCGLCARMSVRCPAGERTAGTVWAGVTAAYSAYRAAWDEVQNAEAAVEAVRATARAAVMFGPEAARGVTGEMERDLVRLVGAAKVEHWTDETPVPREFFGPLWPEGTPPGLPRQQLSGEVRVPTTFRGRRKG